MNVLDEQIFKPVNLKDYNKHFVANWKSADVKKDEIILKDIRVLELQEMIRNLEGRNLTEKEKDFLKHYKNRLKKLEE